jgi:magnesium transporter
VGGIGSGLWQETGVEVDDASATGIRLLALSTDGRSRDLTVEELERVLEDGELVWLDIVHPGDAAIPLLSERLDLGPLTVEDCLLPLRMPKVDPLNGGSAFVAAFVINLHEGDEPRLRASAVAMVIGPSYLVTVRREPALMVTTRLAEALGPDADLPEQSGAALAHVGLDAIVDQHLPIMLRAAEVAEDLEDLLDPASERKGLTALERLIVLRRDLLAFRRLGVAQQEVLRRLGRAFPGMRAHFEDVVDNQREAVDTAAATCDYIDGAIEAYRVRRDARTEDGIRRLTVLAGIIGPVSLIIGLWGVNFTNIPGTESSSGWSIFVVFQLLFTLVGAYYFRRRGLL